MLRTFRQVDVFTAVPYFGNPLAVVHDGTGLGDDELLRFANWTNLSETTFLLPPTHPEADYRVRIFTTTRERPFAGHPTIGSCHAWLEAGGTPRTPGRVVQECGVGLVELRLDPTGRAAFAAPPLRRADAPAATLTAVLAAAGLPTSAVVQAAQLTNGPSFFALLLDSAERVLGVDIDLATLAELGIELGLIGPYSGAPGAPADVEVRLLMSGLGAGEDPVTGSLNAALAQWLIGAGRLPERYVASQGTRLGRAGRLYIERDGETIWVGGDAVTCVAGSVEL